MSDWSADPASVEAAATVIAAAAAIVAVGLAYRLNRKQTQVSEALMRIERERFRRETSPLLRIGPVVPEPPEAPPDGDGIKPRLYVVVANDGGGVAEAVSITISGTDDGGHVFLGATGEQAIRPGEEVSFRQSIYPRFVIDAEHVYGVDVRAVDSASGEEATWFASPFPPRPHA